MNFTKFLPSYFLIALVFLTSVMKLGMTEKHEVLASLDSKDKIETTAKKESQFLRAILEQHQHVVKQHTEEETTQHPTLAEFVINSWSEQIETLIKLWTSAVSAVLNKNLQQLLYPSHFFW